MQGRFDRYASLTSFSTGAWVILVMAVVSSVAIAIYPQEQKGDIEFWTFTRAHARMYEPRIPEWNEDHQDAKVRMSILSRPAIERRVQSAFLADMPVADAIEVEKRVVSFTFAGPLDSVGFLDITDRIEDEGLLDRINPPSLSLWMKEGRVFGLPHDVHPVLLAYRADIVEPLGIDVNEIETWDDFVRVMRPAMGPVNEKGQPERYLIALWDTMIDQIELLMLQAGGAWFDSAGRPVIASEINARVAAQVMIWCVTSKRIATEVPDFTASGNKLALDGHVVCTFMPDWKCNLWRHEIPQLEGKVKLMPIPAWESGGRRTSVWGGTMLGIARSSPRVEETWAFAKHLYFSNELSRVLYTDGDIITPITDHWGDPIFDEPDPFFSGQPKGRMYIEQAPHVPARSASPFHTIARTQVMMAVQSLSEWVQSTNTEDRGEIESMALEMLGDAEDSVRMQMSRNPFVEVVE